MNLFHETENKYYEILSYLLAKAPILEEDCISKYLQDNVNGERDFDVEETLFQKDLDKGTVFKYEHGVYERVIDEELPIRNTQIESQAMKMLALSDYAKHFLGQETIEKLSNVTESIREIWNLNDINVKNQYKFGVSDSTEIFNRELSVIYEAIEDQKAIKYDNNIPGKYLFKDAQVFPLKIEYSIINDVFRICAYDDRESRFIKMNLATMSNVRIQDTIKEHLREEYQDYIETNTKKLILDVDPVDHVIERCFRIFSFYERKAIMDKELQKYKLEINYLKFDENEIIRDILSLGSSVMVIEPKRLQKEVYRRIVKAKSIYEIM